MNELLLSEHLSTKSLTESRTEIEGLTRLVKASLYKDVDTGIHISRVAFMSLELARLLGVDNSFLLPIFYASALHDVGKIAIPDDVLKKTGSLTPLEWSVMRQHSQKGSDFFGESESEISRICYNVSLYHHENYDGSGYPYGLKGQDIPLEARIVSIIDVYDALTMERCYKAAYTHTDAIHIISSDMQSKFDPRILDTFLENAQSFKCIKEIIDRNGPIESLYNYYG